MMMIMGAVACMLGGVQRPPCQSLVTDIGDADMTTWGGFFCVTGTWAQCKREPRKFEIAPFGLEGSSPWPCAPSGKVRRRTDQAHTRLFSSRTWED